MRWNCGGGAWNLEQSSDMEGQADSLEFIPDVPGMLKRNAWHLRILGRLPNHPAQSLPPPASGPRPLLTVSGASADLPNSRPPPFLTLPQMQAPETFLPAELLGNKSVGLIPELIFPDLRYNSPSIWATDGVYSGSQVLPSLNAE